MKTPIILLTKTNFSLDMIVILYVPEGSPFTNSLKKLKKKTFYLIINPKVNDIKKQDLIGQRYVQTETIISRIIRRKKYIYFFYQTRERAIEPKHVKRPNGYL